MIAIPTIPKLMDKGSISNPCIRCDRRSCMAGVSRWENPGTPPISSTWLVPDCTWPRRRPQLANVVPTMIPETIPTVARPSARSAPSGKSNSTRVSAIPPAVPWPPSNPISMRAAAMGLASNNGMRMISVTRMPTTYWPQASACPNTT